MTMAGVSATYLSYLQMLTIFGLFLFCLLPIIGAVSRAIHYYNLHR
jgi:hypothetical protein